MQRSDAHLLPDGDGADGRRAPLRRGPQQTTRFAGKLDTGTAAKSEVANVFVEIVGAHFERQLYRGHVARVLQRFMHGDDVVVVSLVVVDDAAGNRDLAALAVDHVIGLGHVLIERR